MLDWIFFAISLGITEREAQVHQMSVQAIDSAEVANSTFHAAAVVALGVTVQVSTASH